MKRKVLVYAALGLSGIAGSLGVVTPASAQTLSYWRNADTRNGELYLGVSGGYTCDSTHCWVKAGTPLIVWPVSGSPDQVWWSTPTVSGTVKDAMLGKNGEEMCLSVGGSPDQQSKEGAAIVIWPCKNPGDPNLDVRDQIWTIKPTDDVIGTPFPGCYYFVNRKSGQVMGVADGYRSPVKQGGKVVQWPLFLDAWHPDQFWCPA